LIDFQAKLFRPRSYHHRRQPRGR